MIGTVAAVIVALVGLSLALTLLGRRLTGRDLLRKLRVESATIEIEAWAATHAVIIDLSVRDVESDIAVSRYIREFHITWGVNQFRDIGWPAPT